MRKYLFLAAAATVVATPAVARDGSAYVGIEAGGMVVEDNGLNFDDDNDNFDDAFVPNHNTGIDVGLIGGYDWGAFRTEAELAYKRASVDEVEVEGFPGGQQGLNFDADGRTRVLSGMVNLLADIGDDNGWSGYFGGGAGIASIRQRAEVDEPIVGGGGFFLDGEDRSFAWQIIAGVRRAITPNMDIGLKYRMFTSKFEFEEDDGGGVGNPPFTLDGKFRSHSLLASLIFNFGAPPPPPPPVVVAPPPPPPPATKTCPDGSVVLATDPCPLPPPPPPPPPPLPERG